MQVSILKSIKDGCCNAMSDPEEKTRFGAELLKGSSNDAQILKFNNLMFYTYLTVSFY